MDQGITQLLANQLGIPMENGNPQLNDIAAALANQVSDPLMASLITQMASRKQVIDEETSTNHQGYEREIQRLKKIIARLEHELASADVMARYIADIFGACPICWGLNRLCQQCQGRGLPGYNDPNLEELSAWVEPALKKGELHIAHIRQP